MDSVILLVCLQVRLVRRDNGAKEDVAWEGLEDKVKGLLDSIHNDMLKKASEERDASIVKLTSWEGFIEALDSKKMVLAPWCDEEVSRCNLLY